MYLCICCLCFGYVRFYVTIDSKYICAVVGAHKYLVSWVIGGDMEATL